MKKLILPREAGVPNLEIRRMQRELEANKEPEKIHPQTAEQISLHLDQLQKLTQESKVQGMMLCALLVKGAHPKGEALTLFGAPNRDKAVAHELLNYSHEWLIAVAQEMGPPEPPASA